MCRRVLLVLTLGLLCSACKHKAVTEDQALETISALDRAIDDIVEERSRAERAKVSVRLLEGEAREAYQDNRNAGRDLLRLNADYDATPEDFERIFDQLRANRARSAERILRLAIRTREDLTPDEWRALNKHAAKGRG